MKKDQIIEIAQFILVWVFLWLFIHFVTDISFIDFILKYRLYLLIVCFSYFYYYSIKYETDKKYNSIRHILIWWNIYLFAHIFFRPLLNISHELFITLWLITLWLRWTTKIKSKRKIIIQIIWITINFLILLSWIIYLYPESPNIEWFLSTQKCTLQVSWISWDINKKDAYIQITTNTKTEDIIITPSLNKIISGNVNIAYPSLRKIREEYITIIDSEWNIILLTPQSNIEIQIYNNSIKQLNNIEWTVSIFTWILNNWNIFFSWTNIKTTETQLDIINWYQSLYLNNLLTYFQDQISNYNKLSSNIIIQNINWKILTLLTKFFPVKFSKNLKNYNEFQKYFILWKNYNIDMDKYLYNKNDDFNIISTRNNIKNNSEIWKQNTYILNI